MVMDRRHFIRTGLLVSASVATLAACASTPGEETMTEDPTPPEPSTAAAPEGRVLLAYFSRAGENYYRGGRIDLDVGNTQVVADIIAAAIDVDVYRIEAADPYPQSYDLTVQRNVREEQDDARPGIADPLPDVAGRHTILLGCPVWNVQAPMIMRTFVEGLDLTGKTLHPFVTYAVSGMGRVRSDYVDLLPDTTVTQGLAVQGEDAGQSGGDVTAWLRRLGLFTS